MALIFLCVCQCVPSQVWWRRWSCALGWTGAPRPISPPLGPPICPWTPCTRSSFASLPSCSAACAPCAEPGGRSSPTRSSRPPTPPPPAAAWSRLSSSLATTTAPLRSASPTSWIYPAASSSRRLDGHSVVAMPGLNLVSVTSIIDGSFRFVDPATAAAYYVWEGEEPIRRDIADRFLVGQVASTGEYKVLRKVTHSHVGEYGFLYEVCTLSGSRPWWRPAQGPPNTVPLARLKEPVWPLMDLCTS